MKNALAISLVGVIGILSRYGLDTLFFEVNKEFPVSTLLINILGSMAAGAIYAYGVSERIPADLQTILLVGFCGGFTTFSAYALQTMTLLERGRLGVAALYMAISPVLGLLAAFAAMVAVRKLLA